MGRTKKLTKIVLKIEYDPTEFNHYEKKFSFSGGAKSDPRFGLVSFIALLFEVNEIRAASRKSCLGSDFPPLTDCQLARLISNEFKGKWGMQFLPNYVPPKGANRPTINNYRMRFNTGRLRLPMSDRPSFRYNAIGRKVNGRTGNTVLTNHQIAATIINFNARKAIQDARRNILLGHRPRENGSNGAPFPRDPNLCPCCNQRLHVQGQDGSGHLESS